METLDLLNFPALKRHLVLNRADDEVGLTAQNVESILRLPLAVAIPSDTAVAMTVNSVRENPSRSANSRAACLASTTSLSARMGMRTRSSRWTCGSSARQSRTRSWP